jgi:hypothetical protein
MSEGTTYSARVSESPVKLRKADNVTLPLLGLTVADLEASPRGRRNLLSIAKSPRGDDTFAISQTSQESDIKGVMTASLQSILKKRETAAEEIQESLPEYEGQLDDERHVMFNSQDSVDMTFQPTFEQSPKSTTLHSQCPTCRCNSMASGHSSSLRTASMLSSHRTLGSKSSLYFMSKLESNGMFRSITPEMASVEPVNPEEWRAFQQQVRSFTAKTVYRPLSTFIPLSLREENSPAKIFRERLNERFSTRLEELVRPRTAVGRMKTTAVKHASQLFRGVPGRTI